MSEDKNWPGQVVERENLFHKNAGGNKTQVFLVGVDLQTAVRDFEKTVQQKVTLKRHTSATTVSVWGVRATAETETIWRKIRREDVILFSNAGKCFAQGVVWKTIQDDDEARDLWGTDYNEAPRELLIILDNLTPISLDLEVSRIPLIKPMMPEEYHFPIIKVDDKLLNSLIAEYGRLEDVLNGISEPMPGSEIRNVSVTIEESEAAIRRGQATFRKQVLQNYVEKCAVCEIDRADLLEAAHILPVGNTDSAGNVKNGVCLCVLHHKMFDRRYICFDKTRRLVFAKDTPQDLMNTCTKTQITESDCIILPSVDYLEKYYNIFQYTQEENLDKLVSHDA